MAWIIRTLVAVAAFVAVAWTMHRVMQPAAMGYVVDDDDAPPQSPSGESAVAAPPPPQATPTPQRP